MNLSEPLCQATPVRRGSKGRAFRGVIPPWAANPPDAAMPNLSMGLRGMLIEINKAMGFATPFKTPRQFRPRDARGTGPGLQEAGRGVHVSPMDKEMAARWLTENAAPWVLLLAPRVDSIGCTGVALSIPVGGEIAGAGGMPGGIAAAPALAALAETAMGLACARHSGALRPAVSAVTPAVTPAVSPPVSPVTPVNFDMQFLRPARGTRIACAAALVRPGKALIFARAVLTADPSGHDVATASATFAPA